MADNKNDISTNRQTAENEALLRYVSNSLSDEQRHEIEQSAEEDPFSRDAMEGLEMIQPNKISGIIDEINVNLRKEIKKEKRKKRKNVFERQGWVYFAVTLVLLLLVITYLVFKKMKN